MSPHDIYKDQLATLGYGQAIWEPKPTDGTPVAIGDVGYMLFGGFHRLFNIHQSAEVQNNDVPEYFEQLSIDPGRVFDRELKAGAYCSRSVHVHAVSARASPVSLAGGEVSFSTSRQLGAILALPQSAHRRDTLMHRAYTAYIREHCDRWLAFAHYKYVDVELDDLVLVTGCDLAKSWATAAFMGNETNAAASLTIDVGSIANVSASFGMSWKNVQNVIYNWGPAEDLSTSGVDRSSTNAEVGTSSATGGSQFSLTSSQIALAASEVWDQCIFIRGFHMKNRIGSLFPKKLVAFARFKDLEKRGDDDSRPKTPSVVLDPPEVSDNREEREIRYLGEDKRSSLHGPLLDYILKNSEANLAVVHDDDLLPLLAGNPNPDATSVSVRLESLRPETILFDDIVHDNRVHAIRSLAPRRFWPESQGVPGPSSLNPRASSYMNSLAPSPSLSTPGFISPSASSYMSSPSIQDFTPLTPITQLPAHDHFYASLASTPVSPFVHGNTHTKQVPIPTLRVSPEHGLAPLTAGRRGPMVPQTRYKPHASSDQRRYREEVALDESIHFFMQEPEEHGISLADALNDRFARLAGCDEPMFIDRGPSISVRINWPGYQPWSRQIPTRDFRNPPEPITRAKLAKNVAKSVQRFIQEHKNRAMEEEGEEEWMIGPQKIDLFDLVLIRLDHVSKGSWQAQLQLARPLPLRSLAPSDPAPLFGPLHDV